MPHYSYLKTLKQVHTLIRDFAEDFDDNFYMGVCKWNQHMKENVRREEREAREMEQIEDEMMQEDREARENGRWW